jgi:5-methylcytosine-specific restriction protein A
MPRAANTHRPPRTRPAVEERPSAARRGYGRSWQRLRLLKLHADPLCQEPGCVEAATEVDHVDNDRRNLAWENLRSYCKKHHSRKTMRENRGLGR